MDLIDKKLQEYVEKYTCEESEILKKINRHTSAHLLYPRMLSGHLQGRVLAMISHMVRPVNILEIGTYSGYSAICLAEGMQKGGKLITLEVNEELEDVIVSNVREAGLEGQIELKMGTALDIIPDLDLEFDLIFIDADKENYVNYYNLVIPKLRKGSFIVADNVLWDGKVVEKPAGKLDKETEGILQFNEYVHNDDRVENVIFPIRDGLMVLRKK